MTTAALLARAAELREQIIAASVPGKPVPEMMVAQAVNLMAELAVEVERLMAEHAEENRYWDDMCDTLERERDDLACEIVEVRKAIRFRTSSAPASSDVADVVRERDEARAALRRIADAGGNGEWEPAKGTAAGSRDADIWDDGYTEGLRRQAELARAALPEEDAP